MEEIKLDLSELCIENVKLRKELEIYKEALTHLDWILADHCLCSKDCDFHCEQECQASMIGEWSKFALRKAGKY